jgi:hypothetical protein
MLISCGTTSCFENETLCAAELGEINVDELGKELWSDIELNDLHLQNKVDSLEKESTKPEMRQGKMLQ